MGYFFAIKLNQSRPHGGNRRAFNIPIQIDGGTPLMFIDRLDLFGA